MKEQIRTQMKIKKGLFAFVVAVCLSISSFVSVAPKFGARAEETETVEGLATRLETTVTQDELYNSGKYKQVEVGDDLSYATIVINRISMGHSLLYQSNKFIFTDCVGDKFTIGEFKDTVNPDETVSFHYMNDYTKEEGLTEITLSYNPGIYTIKLNCDFGVVTDIKGYGDNATDNVEYFVLKESMQNDPESSSGGSGSGGSNIGGGSGSGGSITNIENANDESFKTTLVILGAIAMIAVAIFVASKVK